MGPPKRGGTPAAKVAAWRDCELEVPARNRSSRTTAFGQVAFRLASGGALRSVRSLSRPKWPAHRPL